VLFIYQKRRIFFFIFFQYFYIEKREIKNWNFGKRKRNLNIIQKMILRCLFFA
jgi:hypothetical protein